MGGRSISTQIANVMEQSEQQTDEVDGAEVGQRLDDLEGALMDNIDGDARLSSGVQPGEDSEDLDFIQMTGLTSPGATMAAAPPAPGGDLDPSAPVSFYERGVQDVDGTMEPYSIETTPTQSEEEVIVAPQPEGGASSDSVENLRSIISDLSKEEFGEDRDDVPVLRPPDEAVAGEVYDESSVAIDSEEPEPVVEVEAIEAALPIAAIDPPEAEREEHVPEGLEAVAEVARDNVVAAASAESEADFPVAPVSSGLAEAETLLQELEGQQGTETLDAPGSEDTPSWAFPEPTVGLDEVESDESVYNRARTSGRRRGHRRKSLGRKLFRFTVWLVVLGAAAAGGVYTYQIYGEFTATEQETYLRAGRLLARGEFVEASMAYANFAAEHPYSPMTPKAEFAAASALWRVPETPPEAAEEAYKQAIALFSAFIQNNPGHAKVARAEILTGILYSRLGQHEQAVRTLYDPNRRLLDQVGYLEALRTLARSYAELGEVESTHAAFLRAASLSENLTPDHDYLELAAFYQGWAEGAATQELRRKYQEAAIKQWGRTLQVPGLVKARRDSIKAQHDALIYTMKGEAASSALVDTP